MFVVFLDLLGFASKVTALSQKDEAVFLAGIRQAPADIQPIPIQSANDHVRRLYDEYVTFQRRARSVVDHLARFIAAKQPQQLKSLRSIVFSDSLFIACDEPVALLRASVDLIVHLLHQDIPCRGGLASGAFSAFEWSARAADEGPQRIEAPFLGSGVVKAYLAESKGARGIRLIIEDSAYTAISGVAPAVALPLHGPEVTPFGAHEANFLCAPILSKLGWDISFGDRIIKPRLSAMQLAAPVRCRPDYDSTSAAVDRMTRYTAGCLTDGVVDGLADAEIDAFD